MWLHLYNEFKLFLNRAHPLKGSLRESRDCSDKKQTPNTVTPSKLCPNFCQKVVNLYRGLSADGFLHAFLYACLELRRDIDGVREFIHVNLQGPLLSLV